MSLERFHNFESGIGEMSLEISHEEEKGGAEFDWKEFFTPEVREIWDKEAGQFYRPLDLINHSLLDMEYAKKWAEPMRQEIEEQGASSWLIGQKEGQTYHDLGRLVVLKRFFPDLLVQTALAERNTAWVPKMKAIESGHKEIRLNWGVQKPRTLDDIITLARLRLYDNDRLSKEFKAPMSLKTYLLRSIDNPDTRDPEFIMAMGWGRIAFPKSRELWQPTSEDWRNMKLGFAAKMAMNKHQELLEFAVALQALAAEEVRISQNDFEFVMPQRVKVELPPEPLPIRREF